ncbi:MAG: aryl-sulfate sulfotransferase [Candidatus Thorarchaeota archaeon]|nr:aryl-sulfate sulfotransferase [Candidatus Thorarchaeota archaeon]
MNAPHGMESSKSYHMFTQLKKHNFTILVVLLVSVSLSVGGSYQYSACVKDEYTISPRNESNNGSEIFPNFASNSVVPTDELEIIHEDGAFNGYNLLVLQRMDEETRYKELFLIIMDMEGYTIAEKEIGANFYLADCPAEWINATAIMYGTPQGSVIWDYYRDTTVRFDFRGHHEYEYNHVNDTIFTFEYESVAIGGEEYLFDKIVEYNLSGDVVWSLDTQDFVSPTQGCPFNDTFYQKPDITHSNTIFYDEEYDVIYYNARNLNTFYKINHSSSEILWGLGEYGNFTLYDKKGMERESLFYHAHAVEKIDTNRFILFDNDYHNQEDLLTKQSRMLEIEVDEIAETATVVWSWEPTVEYWSRIWGDADRLPNDNRLGVFGTRNHPSSSFSARLVEVNAYGDVVWKMDFPKAGGYSYGVYRIERFRYSPGIDSPSTLRFTEGDNVAIDLKFCYNFKPKRDIAGSYNLYLSGNLVSSDEVTFNRYWRYSSLRVDLPELDKGTYNLTLSISDEADHNTTKDVTLIIMSAATVSPLMFAVAVVSAIGIIGIAAAYKSGYFTDYLGNED